jgi:L-fuconolactonase
MRVLSKYKNVSCKISGMVTEAEWNQWTSDEFEPYIDSVTDAFGVDRVMFGSDWPVCLLSASYKEVYHIVKDHFSGYSETEQEQIFGGNAIKFYKL